MPTEQEWPGVMIREASTVHPVLGRGGEKEEEEKGRGGEKDHLLN